MARGVANTRMRDFYDIYVLTLGSEVDYPLLREAFEATSRKRETTQLIPRLKGIIRTVREDEGMSKLWHEYIEDAFFIEDISWSDVMDRLDAVIDNMIA